MGTVRAEEKIALAVYCSQQIRELEIGLHDHLLTMSRWCIRNEICKIVKIKKSGCTGRLQSGILCRYQGWDNAMRSKCAPAKQ